MNKDYSMNDGVLEATGQEILAGTGDTKRATKPAAHRDWGRIFETYIRCLLLLAALSVVAFLAWQPGLMRLSTFLTLSNPSRGEDLAWIPDDGFAPKLKPQVRTRPPAEWRQNPLATTAIPGMAAKPAPGEPELVKGALSSPSWPRLFMNPWTWQNDFPLASTRVRDQLGEPPQIAATSFKVGDIESWPESQTPAAPPALIDAKPEAPAQIAAAPVVEAKSVPAPAPEPTAGKSEAAPKQPERKAERKINASTPLLHLPFLAPFPTSAKFPDRDDFGALEPPALPGAKADTETKTTAIEAKQPVVDPVPTASAVREPVRLELPAPIGPAEKRVAAPAVEAPAKVQKVEIPEQTAPRAVPEKVAPEKRAAAEKIDKPLDKPEKAERREAVVDWANSEITQAIPGAYLTVYPKLKFIGLCVPGQGYIRKYNQVGVPQDSAGFKAAANDGKTPYGKYFVAAKRDGAEAPGLTLSWPSPEDAKRAGLAADKRAEIEAAWKAKRLPPQDTPAGGGLGLIGSDNPGEFTDGGFALTEAQMREILTALPDKAWVLIQQ